MCRWGIGKQPKNATLKTKQRLLPVKNNPPSKRCQGIAKTFKERANPPTKQKALMTMTSIQNVMPPIGLRK